MNNGPIPKYVQRVAKTPCVLISVSLAHVAASVCSRLLGRVSDGVLDHAGVKRRDRNSSRLSEIHLVERCRGDSLAPGEPQ